ncbi:MULTISPECIES: sensor histidine kinase [Streptomyces]|uniref:Histidine kinase n=1 Tax=Streptomyces caniscabiei TaxID=2746961 RepID=A0ABU4N1W8_9ACTN|nr:MULTISPECIES: histidine kinase [Streptomyces]MBE4741010.1 sensor histidine kinase [Streptomyces caniscabiei]MBE4759967.1 sensor histidine kinase [Streptomyces caniscabiei]MBE4774078.1 sensor histidine kinase [Streptomyces caniscabiei]MBE4789302.1 sensor histidine kinase [Streptomyces caniscabiei]MBE4794508.1 sensor histidine kinase [Streptomyces caniscabiei]
MSGVPLGQRPQNRRQRAIKFLWTGIWLAYLSAPVSDLLHGGHSDGVVVLGWIGLVAFVAWYFVLIFRTGRRDTTPMVLGALAVLAAQSVVLALSLGREWLVLFVYVSVASGAALPPRLARFTVPAVSALLTAAALAVPGGGAYLASLLLPALLGGFSMTGVRELIRTTQELREARATVAQLAANEERLRLARDLHDLLGHSLSLITLKSELAGRMLPGRPDQAAQQVADIEQVSRQALVDVREAVTGYRRPRLGAELAGARDALTAAGITPELPADPDLSDVPEESESALAWALRESVTNVVRHSGAHRCTVDLVRRHTLDGPVLELTVDDDGRGAPGGTPGVGTGSGLAGLAERLDKVGGTLEAGRSRHGFRMVARAPASPSGPDVGSGA